MAGTPPSTPPAPPPRKEIDRSINIRHNGSYAQVEVGGVPLRGITDIGLSFLPGALPEVRVSLAPLSCEIHMDDARLRVEDVVLPEAVARAVYEHLRNRFGPGDR